MLKWEAGSDVILNRLIYPHCIMKEKDLKIDYKPHELILYAEKDDQSYDAVQTGSFMARNYLDDWLQKKENLEKELMAELKAGKISPVYYYMVFQDMGIGDLARRMNISIRRLRKHFRPEVFGGLPEGVLEKYAVIFGVSLEELKTKGSDE